MNVVVAPTSTSSIPERRIRVMIVDDAVVVRGLFARWVEAEPDLEVVASLRTGRDAVKAAVMCEDVARTVYLARVLGELAPLPADQVDALHARYQNYYGQR